MEWKVHPLWFVGWMAGDILSDNYRGAGVPRYPWDINIGVI